MATVSLHQLVKTYPPAENQPAFTAVSGINLEIKDREFMVLVGPSGCGKSTTLRMIAGLESISGGTIRIGDAVVNEVRPKDRDIAMVFQNYALYPHLSVFDNMAFGLKLRKMPKAEIQQRVRDAAQLLGIETLLDRHPKALSGGQRQRVAVGRAIVRQPKVFLFDEPLSNLDAKTRTTTRSELVKLHRRLDATMVYVTHDQVEAMTMGDRICVMQDGHIMQVATPLELYRRPANLFVAGFIGSPPMNFIRGQITREGETAFFVEAGATSPPVRLRLDARLSACARRHAGRSLVFGFRPEDAHEADGASDGNLPQITATLELAEPMGAETYLHLTTGVHALSARVSPGKEYRPGQKVRLTLNLSQAHLFDATTESVLN